MASEKAKVVVMGASPDRSRYAYLATLRLQSAGYDVIPVGIRSQGWSHCPWTPAGCTGAKLSTQLFHEMRRRKQKYSMATACVGGGQGIAGIYELLN